MARRFSARWMQPPRLNGVGQFVRASRLLQRAFTQLAAAAPAAALQTGLPDLTALPTDPQKDHSNAASGASGNPPAAPSAAVQRAAPRAFRTDRFSWEGESWPYRLYVPSGVGDEPLPLVVLLHGCTQTATDFALGTTMNALAERMKCYVLYPEQRQQGNASRCWNWFEPAHQQRGQGEAGMIAALTRHTMARREVDPSRVYVAGLSAGGAMASLVGALHPELFAAVGVHSGLPCGAARDIPSALAAMRSGPPAGAPPGDLPPMPTIVFHGTADRTVHPDNGTRIAQAAARTVQLHGRALSLREITVDGAGARTALRTRYLAADGTPWVEHWEVDAGTHGWSGGDTAGSHTDPRGPSASAAMLQFFLQHRLHAAAETA
jgi:poly(hydroxyalkanoate) depolymerase family esterase